MSFLKSLFNFLIGRNTISDEEIASREWILCKSCDVNIEKIDLEANDWICPNCNAKIEYCEPNENQE